MAPTEQENWPLIGMTVEEAAAALRVNPRTVRDMIRDTDFPARKMGGKTGGKSWRIDPDAVKRWLDHGDRTKDDTTDED